MCVRVCVCVCVFCKCELSCNKEVSKPELVNYVVCISFLLILLPSLPPSFPPSLPPSLPLSVPPSLPPLLQGFLGAYIASSRSAFGVAASSVPIYYEQVLCRGDEPALSQCSHPTTSLHQCSHYEDAGVFCQGGFQGFYFKF